MSTVKSNPNDIVAKPKETIFRKKAESIVENMKRRGIEALYVRTSKEAVGEICKMIPAGATVALGGSVTVMQTGLLDRYRAGITNEEVDKMVLRGMTSDVLITSTNAVTADGKLVNEDGRGNRVAAMIYGPKKVIVVAGINKIVGTVEDGLKRIKEVAAPLNCVRLNADTPCARTGFCDDANCRPPARLCSQITIIEANRANDRMHVVLVGEDLGY
jgi:L-lactate utilization protein LutB